MASSRNFKPPRILIIYIVSAFFGIISPLCYGYSDDEYRIIIFKEPIADREMRDHIIKMEEVPNQGSCRVLCFIEPNCVSINFGPKQKGKHKCELNNATVESPTVAVLHKKVDYIYLGIENPCSSSPCFNNGTCQVGYTAKEFRCRCLPGFMGEQCKTMQNSDPSAPEEGANADVFPAHSRKYVCVRRLLIQVYLRSGTLMAACSFDLEHGIDAWKRTGTVFNNQPTFGDNPTARKRGQPSNHQGDWWIGGYENRSSKAAEAGAFQGDTPKGTLTSPRFRIIGKKVSFLIGGGCRMNVIRAELLVKNGVVRNETGNCKETMKRKSWDVQDLIGQHARVRIIDDSSGGWGHINFDDLKGDIVCETE